MGRLSLKTWTRDELTRILKPFKKNFETGKPPDLQSLQTCEKLLKNFQALLENRTREQVKARVYQAIVSLFYFPCSTSFFRTLLLQLAHSLRHQSVHWVQLMQSLYCPRSDARTRRDLD